MDTLWLVIPTYDEAATLPALVRAVAVELEALAPKEWRILVVDDNSPDGTGRIAEGLRPGLDGRLEVLHRPGKGGLGRAYLAGFRHVLAAGAGTVVQMDADFSHDPAHLPALLGALAAGADVALGSRYVPGGRVEDWGPLRRWISRGGSVYARAVLGVDVSDLTGGYKAHRRAVLEGIDLSSIRSEGYSFQIELTYRALRAGFRVREVPITFRDRPLGRSKMSSRIALEAAWLVPRLRGWSPE